MYKIFKNCLSLITRKQARMTVLVMIGNQIGSILEVIGLGIIPILAINLLDKSKLLLFLEKKNISFLAKYIEYENFILYSFLDYIIELFLDQDVI